MSATQLEDALRGRLLEVLPELVPDAASEGATTADLLRLLLEALAVGEADRLWLGYVAVAAAFPTEPQLDDFRRAITLAAPDTLVEDALASIEIADGRHRRPGRSIRLLKQGVVVDVSFCATHVHNTGIQRVVRSVMPRWQSAGRPAHLMAWTPDDAGYRELSDVERNRVLDWNPSLRHSESDDGDSRELVVPWRCQLVLPEVPQYDQCGPIACLAEAGASTVDVVGYDVIPVTSADTVSAGESERFAIYLNIVKHARAVHAISETVADEFRGFARALVTQGLPGPRIDAVSLAVDVPPGARELARTARGTANIPTMVCVGSHEPRKNQEAVLFAAQRLHREGYKFRLVFVGGGNRRAYADFDRRVARLRRAGMLVEAKRKVGDAELWELLGSSRFSVFVSLHEGFGLPVAESLAVGVPVLTSDRGSLHEIAAYGGCLQVDPRDDNAIVAAMRRLLNDDDLRDSLAAEAEGVMARSWDEYADELWSGIEAGRRS